MLLYVLVVPFSVKICFLLLLTIKLLLSYISANFESAVQFHKGTWFPQEWQEEDHYRLYLQIKFEVAVFDNRSKILVANIEWLTLRIDQDLRKLFEIYKFLKLLVSIESINHLSCFFTHVTKLKEDLLWYSRCISTLECWLSFIWTTCNLISFNWTYALTWSSHFIAT